MARILHIGEHKVRKKVKEVLTKKGFEVISVATAERALEHAKKERPSLVLTDVNMPKISGWELCQKIKKINQDIPVAFLSDLEISKERESQLKKEGVAGYIKRPIEEKEFVVRIKKLLSNKF